MSLLRFGVLASLTLLAGCAVDAPTTPAASSGHPSGSVSAPSPSTSRSHDTATLNQELRDAAWNSDVRTATTLIAEGADVNAKDDTIQSAYLIAASEGDLGFMRLMLANGADVSALDSWGGTGLTRAAERGNSLVVGALLQTDIDTSHVNTIGYQAIHEAVWLGHDTDPYVDTIRVLSAGGVDLETASEQEDLTPLQMAEDRGFERVETTLRAQLEGEDATDADSALIEAVEADDADRAARALRDGANINAVSSDGTPALLLALADDNEASLRLLVALGADAAAPDAHAETPLLSAASDGNADFVALVATAPGLNLDLTDAGGRTALMRAVVDGDGGDRYQRVARTLLDAGADPSVTDAAGLTAADHAEAAGQEAMAAVLAEDKHE